MATHTVKVPLKQPGTPHKFEPSNISVKKGDSVEWVNEDTQQHTVTSDDGGVILNGKLAGKGDKYSHTFSDAGDVPYHCEIHGSMTGVVNVTPK